MKKTTQLSPADAADQLHHMLRQWQNNAAELHKHCRSSDKIQDVLHSLAQTVEAVDGWADLPGSIGISVMYQPSFLPDDPNDVDAFEFPW